MESIFDPTLNVNDEPLYRSGILNGNGSPIGVVTPTFEGQEYIEDDATPKQLWKSNGLTNSDWQLIGNAVGEISTIDESTGVKTGGVLSVGAGSNQYSISDGTGQTVLADGTKTEITWSGLSNIVPTNIGTQLITFVGIKESATPGVGEVVEQSTNFTPTQRKTIITLGVAVHVDLVNVDVVNNEQQTAYNTGSGLYSLMESLGFFNINGNEFSANGANMTLDKSTGLMFKAGSNYDTDVNDEHRRSLSSLTGLTFQYRFSDGSNGVTGTNIDPDNLDDGAGGLTAVGNNQWSIQRIYSFTSNNVKIQRGVAEYASLDDARAGRTAEPYVTEPSIKANGLLRGWLYVKKGATVLNGADAFIEEAPKFGEGGGSAGSGGAVGKAELHMKIAYESVTASDNINFCRPGIDVTVQSGIATVQGSTPSATMQVFFGPNRDGTGKTALTNSVAVTNTTTGQSLTFNDQTVPADSFVWVETTAVGGTVDELYIDLIYTED